MKNLTNSIICWVPETKHVFITPWPDAGQIEAIEKGLGVHLRTGGACWSHVQKLPFSKRKEQVFIDAVHLIVRDKCDPMAVHNAFSVLEEYRDGLAYDMPRTSGWGGLDAN